MRLFAFGCSFTRYHYPTWADILIKEYPQGYNCGRIGAGNTYISTSIWEIHALYNFSSKDTVAICWSNIFREDRYHQKTGWHTPGNIFFNLSNRPLTLNRYEYKTDEEWADLVFYLVRDFGIILSTTQALKNLGVNVLSFSIGDVFNDPGFKDLPINDLTRLLNQKEYIGNQNIANILDLYSNIVKLDCVSMMDFLEYQEDQNRLKYNNNDVLLVEDHPLPGEHLKYAETVLSPLLGKSITSETMSWIDQWDEYLTNNDPIKYPIESWKSEISKPSTLLNK